MYTLENTMARVVDQSFLAAGKTTPKHKDQILPPIAECLDGGIGKYSPPSPLVAVCDVCPDGQRGVEQENPLLRPARQVTGLTDRRTQIGGNLLIDILQ